MTTPGSGQGPAPQTFRPVYHLGTISHVVPNAPIANVVPRLDRKSGEYIILWNDVLRVFKDAQYILRGSEVVNFLVDNNFEELKPLRIALYPDEVLNVALNSLSHTQPMTTLMSDMLQLSSTMQATMNAGLTTVADIPLPGSEIAQLQETPPLVNVVKDSVHEQDTDRISSLNTPIEIYFAGSQSDISRSSTPNSFQSALEEQEQEQEPPSGTISNTDNHTTTNTTHGVYSVPIRSTGDTSSGRIKSGIRRAPQAAVDPLNLAQAPSDIQGRILAYMRQIQSLPWDEASMPRIFIVLPKSCPHNDQLWPSSDGFRFFWMCEHSCDHPDGADDQSGDGSSPYLHNIHSGFVLDRPSEFFDKYGVHLLLNLQLFMYSRRSVSDGHEGSKTASVGYDQGVEYLRKALGMSSRHQVEQSLDWMINHLLSLTLESMMENQLLHPQLETTSITPPQLKQHDLHQLRSFLIMPPGSVSFENLYRSVDEDGQVQWVCFTHNYELHPFFFPSYIQSAVEKCGGYNYSTLTTTPAGVYRPKVGQVSVQPRSSSEILNLFSALVAGSGCVPDLVLRFTWDVSVEDLRYIRDAVHCFGVVSLLFTGPGFRGASYGHAEIMVQILEHSKVQSFSLEYAQAVLEHLHPHMLMDRLFEGLQTLRLSMNPARQGSENVGSGLVSVIQNSPNLKTLWITWESMEEIVSVDEFLRSIVIRQGPPLDVFLIIQRQTIMLTIDHGDLQNISVRIADFAIAVANPLVSNGLVKRLRIANHVNVQDEHDTLLQILTVNRGLQTLELDCSVDSFQNTVQQIQWMAEILPNCALSSLTLQDSTRGRPILVYQAQILTHNDS
ncbi:hypothetical protein BGZ65_011977 [Modicella reniformis]|uniref:Uncharacterized protein n=1 Tax=Modicella reniformis TaxID=1440133 RepID=A0A9P6IP98_9FUNG|nr:hypothetical protein BGZ65_011977 [Modicella reniformis]